MDVALRILHVLAAAVWVGGTIALVFIAVPVIRALQGEARAASMRALGQRWRWIGWGALTFLVATGLASAALDEGFRGRTLGHTGFGGVLIAKMALVAGLAVLAALHDFVLGPRLQRQIREGGPQSARPALVRVGWASLVLTVVIPVLGVVLAHLRPDS